MDRDARLVDKTLKQLRKDSEVPAGYFQVGSKILVSRDEAVKRYDAAIGWFKEMAHLVISNGPFLLERYDPPAQYAELKAFRDPTYPFKPGDWDFGPAPILQFAPVDSVEIDPGKRLELSVTVQGPGVLGLRYLLIDPATRTVAASGDAEAGRSVGGSTRFAVTVDAEVTKSLFPGLYQLSMVAYSDSVALVVERTVDIDVTR